MDSKQEAQSLELGWVVKTTQILKTDRSLFQWKALHSTANPLV